ncbi:hypothetical protein CAPGI0001_2627 [Capnocytophaga gingivalis ATCC 33624]|jgi:hypothetical protein|nr:hypothetical protein CAPGI0001_2627 [Capnocytophaga gingivalis ATCC 33624]
MSYLLFIIFYTKKGESIATKKEKYTVFYNFIFTRLLRRKKGYLSFFRQKKPSFIKMALKYDYKFTFTDV